jgi:putative DNA primase/helicase
VIHQIVTGQREPPVTGLSEHEAEMRKKILAVLIAGDPLVRIDNITQPVDSATLCAVITSPTFSDRLLGVSTTICVSTAVTWILTGNNLSLVGDLTSRALLCTLDPEMELPEERAFKRDILQHVTEHRGTLLAAALTLPLAYLAAGAPQLGAPETRFPEWDRLVRRPLLWLGAADPLTTQADLREEDPERTNLITVLHILHKAFPEHSFTTADIMQKIGPMAHGQSLWPELQQAFAEIDVAGDKLGNVSPSRIGRYLRHSAGRIESGLRIQKTGKDRVTKSLRFRVMAPAGVRVYDSRFRGEPEWPPTLETEKGAGASGAFGSSTTATRSYVSVSEGESTSAKYTGSAETSTESTESTGEIDEEFDDEIPF